MAREPIETWFFVLVVVRKDDKFLLIQEKKFGQTWYLPAGRVEASEKLTAAALRETLEESGVPIALDGILRIEHTPIGKSARLRVVYVGHPVDDTPPISTPNGEALQARWVTLEDAKKLPLRGFDVVEILQWVEGGATVYPLSLIIREDASYSG
jgi:8-oxo-dGTP pyrophosphatase MutT (NUDIX family)